MSTIVLNLAAAAVWAVVPLPTPLLIIMSVVVFVYSLAHDWHEDAAAYRDALADRAADR